MKIAPIRNENDYQKALDRFELIIDAKKGTEQGFELEILSIFIDRFENENFPINMLVCLNRLRIVNSEWNNWE